MDMRARMDAYRRQSGRMKLTPRQMRQTMRMVTHQTAQSRRAQLRELREIAENVRAAGRG